MAAWRRFSERLRGNLEMESGSTVGKEEHNEKRADDISPKLAP
jgi:hypothetical protein